MTEEEIKEMRKNKKKILFKGHKKTNISSCWWTLRPLAMGGEDDVENLSCTCYPCNLFKGNILPSDFMERITDIFLYQMEKQHKDRIIWKIVHKILNKMI